MQKDLPRPADKGAKPAKPLLLIGEASELLGVSIDTIRRWDSLGKIRVIRTPGRTRLIPRDEIERLKAGGRVTPEKPPEVKELTAPQIPIPIIISKPTQPTLPIPPTQPQKLPQKIIHHIRFTRPLWYQRWHSHPASRPTHLAILGIVLIAAASLFVYQWFIVPTRDESNKKLAELGKVLAAATPPRILSFQGRLTDDEGVPVSDPTNIRFRIYTSTSGDTGDPCANTCKWESKTWSVDPDQNGIFSVILGDTGAGDTEIPPTLFSENDALYLGVKVGSDAEMTPRQRIASVSYALNSDALEGFHGSQSPGANQVPILNGSGSLIFVGAATIGTAASGALTLDSDSSTLTLGAGTNTIVNTDATTALLINPTGELQFQSSSNYITSAGALTLAGSITIASGQSYTGTGAVTLSSGSNSDLTIDANGSGNVVFTGFTSCSALETNGSAQLVCGTDDGGGGALHQITAATADNSINSGAWNQVWNWQLTGAETGFKFSENAASTGGGTQNQFILEASTLTGSTASPFRVLSNSVDAADIVFNLNSDGDFEIQDAGTAFVTFSSTGTTTINSGGLTITAGALAVNSDSITSDGALSISATSGTITIDSSGTVRLGTDDDFLPQLGAGDADLGASGTRWDNVYAVAGSFSGAVSAVGVNAGAGLLQGSLGLTITGAAISLNASSNFDTNINTGTSTGTITIGNSSSTAIKLGKFTTGYGVLYISATDGTVAETGAASGTQCLQGTGASVGWGACGSTYTAGNDLDLNGNQFDIESTLNYVQTITRDGGDLILSTTSSGKIAIDPIGNLELGNGTNAKTISIGTGAANTITIGSGSATGVSITDNNWSITTAGVLTTTGLITASAVPAGTGVGQGSLYINPASATADYTLLGLAVGGSEKFRIDENGDVDVAGHGAFGSSASISTQKLVNIAETIIAEAGTDTNCALCAVINVQIDNVGRTGYGSYIKASTLGSNNAGSLYGIWAEANKNDTGGNSVTYALYARLSSEPSVAASAASYGIYVDKSFGTAPTTSYGIDIENMGTAGTTTTYGLYIADQTGSANNYPIYQAGTNGTNIFNAATTFTLPAGTVDFTIAGIDSDSNVIFSGLNNCDTIDTDANGVLSCGTDAGAGSSPFGSSGGIITKSTAGDYLSLRYGDAADTQLIIENTTSTTIPTADAMQIDLSGNTTGIVTNGVDALYIKAEFGNGSANTNSLLHLDLDPVNTPSGDEYFYAVNIDALAAGTSANERAIYVGANWDYVLDSAAVDISGAGVISGATGFTSSGTITFSSYADCSALATNGGGALFCGAKTRSFLDNTNDTISDSDTVNYWDGTYPNITPKATTNEILVIVSFYIDGAGTTDVTFAGRILRTTGGTNPVCQTTGTIVPNTSSYVGGALNDGMGSFTATFVDAPAVTTEVRYTLCGDADGSVTAGNMRQIEFTLIEIDDAADLAEVYPTNDTSLQPGEIVSLDPDLTFGVRRSARAYDKDVLGVVSTRPAQVIGSREGKGASGVPVALTGRVPVRVNGENGPIAVGDLITSSSTPGVGMRANRPGYVIGRALTPFSGEGEGVVLAFVNTHYANPAALDSSGNLLDLEFPNPATASATLSCKDGPCKALPIQLDSEENNIVATISAGTKFIWTNSVGKVLAWVSDAGEVVFEKITALVGDFRKLIFGELVAKKDSQVAGQASFEPGQTEVFIESDKVTEESLIYITPTTKTAGLTLYLKAQKPGEGFVVALERSIGDLPDEATASAKQVIRFNWLIVNQEE